MPGRSAGSADRLKAYKVERDFSRTPEPPALYLGLREDKPARDVQDRSLANTSRSKSTPPPPFPAKTSAAKKSAAKADKQKRGSSENDSGNKGSAGDGVTGRSGKKASSKTTKSNHQSSQKTGNQNTKKRAADLAGVKLSSPEKILFPSQGISKKDLAEYLVSVQHLLLPHARRRPLTLVRCPRGRSQKCFFQKHHGSGLPAGLAPVNVTERNGKQVSYLYIDDLQGLVGSAQVGALELHIWGSRIEQVEQPDRMVFDLDPDESLQFDDVRKAAQQLRAALKEAGLESFPLLTGGKGIHVVVPLKPEADWPTVKAFARGFSRSLAEHFPDDYVATASKEKRRGRIYLDWLRNERGSTAIAPYATRAREDCPVAVPVSWRELPKVKAANQYTLNNLARRLSALKADPWANYFDLNQTIPAKSLEQYAD